MKLILTSAFIFFAIVTNSYSSLAQSKDETAIRPVQRRVRRPKIKHLIMQHHDTRHHDIIIGDMCICAGTVQMIIPEGGSHVRQADVRLRKFIGTPTVTASISSPDSNGTMFSLWSNQINDLGSETQIVFSAANVEIGKRSHFTYFVSYVVIGRIR